MKADVARAEAAETKRQHDVARAAYADAIAHAKTPNQLIRAMAKATQPASLMHQMAHKRRAHR